MTALKKLSEAGQSVWLDSISRDMLENGTLARYVSDLSVTGLTSNPTIFERAIASTDRYDPAIRSRLEEGLSPEELFFALALEDIGAAADLFRPIYDATGGCDGLAAAVVARASAASGEGT